MAREERQILDADGHIIEWDQELYEYLQPPYKGNTALLGYPFFPSLDGYQRGAILARTGIHKSYAINADTWINFLDEVGIQTAVLYPTAGLGFGIIQDPDWAVALARAYNDWFADRYYRANKRLRAVALVPLQDVSEAVREARRAVNELGMVGLVLPANGGDLGLRKPLGHPDFWPLYEEAERLNCPIAIHGAPSQGIGLDFFTRFAASHALEHPLAQMVQLTSLVFEGVFERFPKLKVVLIEGGFAWTPALCWRMDKAWERMRAEVPHVKRPPSEYVREHVWFTTQPIDEPDKPEHLVDTMKWIGFDRIMFSTDYPHWDFDDPARVFARLKLTAQQRAMLLRDNARALYGLA